MSEPGAVQDVLDFLSATPAASETLVKQLLQSVFSGLKPILASDPRNDFVGPHTNLLGSIRQRCEAELQML